MLSRSGKFPERKQSESSQDLFVPDSQPDSKEDAVMGDEQGSKEHVLSPMVQDTPRSASQDNQLIAPGQKDRNDVLPPQPSSDKKRLTPVTHSFVYELVGAVEANYVSLAILEDKLDTWNPVVDGHAQVPEEFRTKRRTPSLGQGYNFSVTARQELESMYKVHDLAFIRRLRDDLITSVIPDCKCNIQETLAK